MKNIDVTTQRKIFTHKPIDLGYDDLLTESTEEGRKYVTPDGEKYPSITTVLGHFSKAGIMEWRKRVGEEEANRVSARASARGTRIHQYCEDYLRGNLFEMDMFDTEMFNSIKFLLDQVDNIHCLETPLWSDHLQVAGTVDCIGEFQGKLSVIDFKTASKPKDRDDIYHYFMQCAAYSVAFEERTGIPIDDIVIAVSVESENTPQIFCRKKKDYIEQLKYFVRLNLESLHKQL